MTGFNSNILSMELSTKLSGRCWRFLSAARVLRIPEFQEFGRYGQALGVLHPLRRISWVSLIMDVMPGQVKDILDGIYNTVFNRDVMGRHEIRRNAMISNLSIYLMKNIGDRASIRGVFNYLTSKSIGTQPQTVDQ